MYARINSHQIFAHLLPCCRYRQSIVQHIQSNADKQTQPYEILLSIVSFFSCPSNEESSSCIKAGEWKRTFLISQFHFFICQTILCQTITFKKDKTWMNIVCNYGNKENSHKLCGAKSVMEMFAPYPGNVFLSTQIKVPLKTLKNTELFLCY